MNLLNMDIIKGKKNFDLNIIKREMGSFTMKKNKEYYEEPNLEILSFETEDIMTQSTTQPETDEDGWTVIIVKP